MVAHVTQVAAAVLADDLDALHAHAAVRDALDGVGQIVVEGWPATPRVELGARAAPSRSITSGAPRTCS